MHFYRYISLCQKSMNVAAVKDSKNKNKFIFFIVFTLNTEWQLGNFFKTIFLVF